MTISRSVIELLTDQICELTTRLEASTELCSAYRSLWLNESCSYEQLQAVMSDLSVTGCIITTHAWDNMDSVTKALFLGDVASLARL